MYVIVCVIVCLKVCVSVCAEFTRTCDQAIHTLETRSNYN